MKKATLSRVILQNSTSIERHVVQGIREPWTRVNGEIIDLTYYTSLNLFHEKGMDIEKVRRIAGLSNKVS